MKRHGAILISFKRYRQTPIATNKEAHANDMNIRLLRCSYFNLIGDFLETTVIKQMLYINYVLCLLFLHKQFVLYIKDKNRYFYQ